MATAILPKSWQSSGGMYCFSTPTFEDSLHTLSSSLKTPYKAQCATSWTRLPRRRTRANLGLDPPALRDRAKATVTLPLIVKFSSTSLVRVRLTEFCDSLTHDTDLT